MCLSELSPVKDLAAGKENRQARGGERSRGTKYQQEEEEEEVLILFSPVFENQ